MKLLLTWPNPNTLQDLRNTTSIIGSTIRLLKKLRHRPNLLILVLATVIPLKRKTRRIRNLRKPKKPWMMLKKLKNKELKKKKERKRKKYKILMD